MSELNIGLVAEGETDKIVIEAALNAVLSQNFILNLLQPERTSPRLGGGWCGVLKWCLQVKNEKDLALEDLAILEMFDLLIIHLDVDVASFNYADAGVEKLEHWYRLPCNKPCPPAKDSANELKKVIASWLKPMAIGSRTILCLPAQAIESWLAVACLPSEHKLLKNVECKGGLSNELKSLPKSERIKKGQRYYRTKSSEITSSWRQVKLLCPQAKQFEEDILKANTHNIQLTDTR